VAAAVNNYWQMTGAQLTVGSVATPLEFKSFADDLRACQRYYYRIQGDSGDYSSFCACGTGYLYGSLSLWHWISFPVPMRIAALAANVTSSGLKWYKASADVNYDATVYGVRTEQSATVAGTSILFNLLTTTVSAGVAVPVFLNTASTAFFAITAEL
jgi:hypothetical protein